MNYATIDEGISHFVRDASWDLAEDFHLAIMDDPGQRWSTRGRLSTMDEAVDEVPFDLC